MIFLGEQSQKVRKRPWHISQWRDVHRCASRISQTFTSAMMAPPDDFDVETLETPENCVADFCLIPVFVQLQLQVPNRHLTRWPDRNTYSISVARGCRRSALDAEEQFDVCNAFSRNDCG